MIYLEKIAYRLADRLIKRGADSDNREVYRYAIELILSTLAGISCILILALLSHNLAFGIIFLLFFCPLRSVVGGYHAITYLKCLLVSCAIFVCCLVVCKLIAPYKIQALPFFLGVILIAISIFQKSPVINEKQPLTEQQIQRNKKLTFFYLLISTVTICFLYHILYPFALMAAIALTAVLILQL